MANACARTEPTRDQRLPSTSREKLVVIFNFLTRQRYVLCRADSIAVNDTLVRQLTFLCNEPEIYDHLFRLRLQGARFTIFHGYELLSWAVDGWKTGDYQVFFLVDQEGDIVASVDVRTWQGWQQSRGDAREIGYWCSSFHSGLMTNALSQVLRWLGEEGVVEVHARVQSENERSRGVLRRSGFALLPPADGVWVEFLKILGKDDAQLPDRTMSKI